MRAFGQSSAYYDANGHYARVSGLFPDFELGAEDTLKPANPSQVVQGLKTGQLRRCPGAAHTAGGGWVIAFHRQRPIGLRPERGPLMNRRRSNSLAGSPLLIGAVTTLIVVVAVFLSYNANNGLPFTPTYDIKVQLPEASGLQKGNQVRIGGERVGVISGLSPYQDPKTGRVTAIVSLKLEKAAEPLPADTTAIVQSVSTIGLKYLALERGHSERKLKAGETIPVSQTREPVDIDQFFDMFDEKTRKANQVNLTSFGNGFAGRGIGLNETISTLRPLVTNAIPVLHNLASPKTGFGQLFVALDRLAKEVAPVANENAALYTNLNTFFTAWASVAPSLEQTIAGAPPALRQATHSFPFHGRIRQQERRLHAPLAPERKDPHDRGGAARTRL